MRMIVGLDRTSGQVLVNGRPYPQHAALLQEVGALLDAKAVHNGRSAGPTQATEINDERNHFTPSPCRAHALPR
jgi:hypothetical protein